MEARVFDYNGGFIAKIFVNGKLPEKFKVLTEGRLITYIKESKTDYLEKVLRQCSFVTNCCDDCNEEDCPFSLKQAKSAKEK